jgi:hypothetical protein
MTAETFARGYCGEIEPVGKDRFGLFVTFPWSPARSVLALTADMPTTFQVQVRLTL